MVFFLPVLSGTGTSVVRVVVPERLVRRGVERRRARIVYPWVYTVSLWFPRIARWFTARFSPPVNRLAAKT